MKLSPNEVASELERVHANQYRQFIKKVRLKNVRGFADESIEFKNPVTALVGTNGGGKSTILGAAALSYKNIRPGQFFPKAFIGDESMSDWSVEIELVDKNIAKDRIITRTARFSQSKWRRDGFQDRPVEYIEIQRTVPAGELTRFRKFLSGDPEKFEIRNLGIDTIKYASAVLDKSIEHYRVVVSRENKLIKMYVGATSGEIGYSQFHFGAGEASVIETIDRIESAPDNSLILIEEVENGLHPVAVRLFVQYLQNAAKRKKLQIIFTTHSQEAVDQLPSEAVWASINKRAWNGKLSIESLRAITGNIPNTRTIYVEDDFVKEWVENAIGRYGNGLAESTKVFSAGGYPNVVKVSQFHNENPTIRVPSIALVDGDVSKDEDISLPDSARFIGYDVPERTVFDYIYSNMDDLISLIRQRCFLSRFDEYRIKREIESVRNSACDPHIIFSSLSEKLDFVSSIYIRAGMIDLFNEKNHEFWREIIEFISEISE
ncbi:MAG: AAA domain [Saliniramus fredricksonii]|uniref:AAA domain n=1 Tax=Saliniramus fredricksonii TaxID=1653334 RepID=A0A0P7X395_9HYPH|nr:ATP-binding protein [Saliniramus fredricksonii]KPQ09164.1 MAG: AAA domain [Saliniramus fredricksonii]SCC80773.1 ATPase/GTPase, AAA15 family [Saliniramus fredricksonii]